MAAISTLKNAVKSLSARRAWIEIDFSVTYHAVNVVALRKESVDRNKRYGLVTVQVDGRSPQGERG